MMSVTTYRTTFNAFWISVELCLSRLVWPIITFKTVLNKASSWLLRDASFWSQKDTFLRAGLWVFWFN